MSKLSNSLLDKFRGVAMSVFWIESKTPSNASGTPEIQYVFRIVFIGCQRVPFGICRGKTALYGCNRMRALMRAAL